VSLKRAVGVDELVLEVLVVYGKEFMVFSGIAGVW